MDRITPLMKINPLAMSLAAAALAAASAQADIVPIGLLWTPGLPFSTISYEAGLTLGQQLLPGDRFFIIDIPTFASVGSVPPDWTAFTQLLSVQPLGISTGDLPTEENVLFVYSGPVINGPRDLGAFDIFVDPNSDLDFTFNNNWVGAAHQLPILGGELTANITSVPVPTAVPEASTVSATVGLALAAGAIGFNRRQRRQQRR